MTLCSGSGLPFALYTVAAVRELDRQAIEVAGIPGIRLMHRAGAAAFQSLQEAWPDARCIRVLCGGGNNGGDGYIVAGLAARRGWGVQLISLVDPGLLKGDAALARDYAAQAGVSFVAAADADPAADGADVLVDGLLGTGVKGGLRADCKALIEAVNAAGLPVLALDVPSGVDADTGQVSDTAVMADITVTFIGLKRGLLTGDAPAYTGELQFDDLAVPATVYEAVAADAQRVDLAGMLLHWQPRAATAHKGRYGHALLAGGDHGMGGAIVMAATATARCGAGLISCRTRPAHLSAMLSRTPEIMVAGVDDWSRDFTPFERLSAVAIGPGLGQGDWGRDAFAAMNALGSPMVVDADALNLLAGDSVTLNSSEHVLTPHPGEAARLLQCSVAEVQADRFAAARSLSERYAATVVLKGAGTVIAGEDGVRVCTAGNPGMASGGMGDVLTGIVCGLLAQGFSAEIAARLGVCLHAEAADRAARDGERGLLATDLLEELRPLVNGL